MKANRLDQDRLYPGTLVYVVSKATGSTSTMSLGGWCSALKAGSTWQDNEVFLDLGQARAVAENYRKLADLRHSLAQLTVEKQSNLLAQFHHQLEYEIAGS